MLSLPPPAIIWNDPFYCANSSESNGGVVTELRIFKVIRNKDGTYKRVSGCATQTQYDLYTPWEYQRRLEDEYISQEGLLHVSPDNTIMLNFNDK